ncbi:mitotic checkpoint regulator, MAD2B-interacting-domain-containing protein [Lentinula boryana]|uniref:Mitotic checkpoint regulator, MAD2B-interacting-domain-containing protein n=1 Tax=Lentinula boryana TaxID=40481 RepID=A0ABQ8QQE2_9AGAR|nr:mitotic checkpoint regulator, MAD2B-interacting-domain-containing protein [Lentinula boryana]
MLGIEDYGSGSDSDGELGSQPKKSSVSLPPPSTKAAVKKKKTIAISLPALKPANEDDGDDLQLERPPAKKPKLGAGVGAGSSSLLSMLPAPKQKALVAPAPERVLGSGKGPGLVFNTWRSTGMTSIPTEENEQSYLVADEPTMEQPISSASSTSFAFRPPSLVKGKANISLEEEKPKATLKSKPSAGMAIDFFGLGSTSSSSSTSQSPGPSTARPSSASSVSVSSAPEIPSFSVPEPSINDPYPGYYQLSSGEWRQHEPEYFDKFRKRWEKAYNDHVRTLEKGAAKGFEGYDRQEMVDVDAAKEMEKAKIEIKEREERKAVSKDPGGEPAKPKMNITAAKLSGRARSRHQLATLLNEAYENRESMEEKIAEGRRNRKEAGNKYGTSITEFVEFIFIQILGF